MADRLKASIPKLPFYAADLIVSGIAFYVLYRLGSIAGVFEAAISAVCLAAAAWGAWLSVLPWLSEYRADADQAAAADLKASFDKLQDLRTIAAQIQNANLNWTAVQEASATTVKTAREISDKMKAEAGDFMKFFQNASDQEKEHLKLEVDKLRRVEGDWLQVTVRILDHIFALHQAGLRSGQENLINQLAQFQATCRDIARRVGLMAFVPNPGEPFDEKAHQPADPNHAPEPGAPISLTAAPGYTFQGHLLRRALVQTGQPQIPEGSSGPASPEQDRKKIEAAEEAPPPAPKKDDGQRELLL